MKSTRILTLALLVVFLDSFAPLALTADRGPSTPQERAQALQVIHDFEANPLSPSNAGGLAWVTVWAVQVPDIHIKLCISYLGNLAKGTKKDSQSVFNGLFLGQTEWAIQNMGKQDEAVAQQLAGVESALRVYEKLLLQKPGDRQSHLDELITRRSAGTLRKYVEGIFAGKCKT